MTRSLTAILLLLTAVSANAQEERAIDNFAGLGAGAGGSGCLASSACTAHAIAR